MNNVFGLTLIELLVCLVIVCSLCFLSLPFGQVLYQKNQLDVIDEEIRNAIRYARNIALLKGMPVTLNPLPGSTDWSRGMVLFVDNDFHQYSLKDELIHQWQWHHNGTQVIWKGFRSNHYLTFSPILRQSTCNGSFYIFNQVERKNLIVNRFGHMHSL